MIKLKIAINENQEYNVEENNQGILLNGDLQDYSISKISERDFLIHIKTKVYRVHTIEKSGAFMKLNINGHEMSLGVKDHMAQILEKLGMDLHEADAINELYAPMPGAIIEVVAKEGDEIKEGDTLLILEAMKMENIIKSPINGKVERVHVSKAQNVEKNQILISF